MLVAWHPSQEDPSWQMLSPEKVRMQRPNRDEYPDYFHPYVERVADGDILVTLKSANREALELLRSLSGEQADSRYAPGKWSIKEVFGHLIDAERILGMRALRFARREPAPMLSFDQDHYAAVCDASQRTVEDLAAELDCVRASHLAMFRSFSDEAWQGRGRVEEHSMTARAQPWIIAGHEMHHVEILRERYLP